jgi:hypothetical protein
VLTTKAPFPDQEFQYDITFEDDHLVAAWHDAPNPVLLKNWLLLQSKTMLIPAFLEDGKLLDVAMDLALEFTMAEGKAEAFDLYGPGEAHWGTAKRAEH